MQRILFHLWGPIAIQSYGFFIALGIMIGTFLACKSQLRKQVTDAQTFLDIIFLTIIVGIFGGRILYLIQEWHTLTTWTDAFALWNGGFSVLGTVIAIVTIIPTYLYIQKISILLFLDLLALHAPITQSIARIGCFFAGCCHGVPTNAPWAITYCDPESMALLGVPVHPTQLYSSLIFLLMFGVLQLCYRKLFCKPGQIIALYLILAGLERFTVDFWRSDREYFLSKILNTFSFHQWIALVLVIIGVILLLYQQQTLSIQQRSHESI